MTRVQIAQHVGRESAKHVRPVRVSRVAGKRKPRLARRLFFVGTACVWDACRTGSAPGPLARTRALFVTCVCATGAELLEGHVQILWQTQNFRVTGATRSHCWNASFANPMARTDKLTRSDIVAGAALLQGQVRISWQAQHFQ